MMLRFARALGAALALLAVLAGGAWALLHWGRLDVFASLSWGDVLRPDDGSLLLGVLTAVGWLALAWLAATVVCEAVAALSRGRWHPRLPGTGWLRPMVAVLVATVLGLSTAAGAASGVADRLSADDDAHARAHVAIVRDSVNDEQAVATAAAPAPGLQPYVVRPGDDLWSLAERFAGGGDRWRVLAEANSTVVLDAHADLVPGTMLMMPQAGSATVTVRRGDTLWDLSAKHLGDPMRWPELYAANRSIIRDPNLIFPGQKLVLPGATTPAPPVAPPVEAEPPATPAPAQPPAAVDLPPVAGTIYETSRPGADQPVGQGHESVDDGTDDPHGVETLVLQLLGSIGVGLAAALLTGLASHRLMQLRDRPVGRAVPPVPELAQQFETALDRRAASLLRDGGPTVALALQQEANDDVPPVILPQAGPRNPSDNATPATPVILPQAGPRNPSDNATPAFRCAVVLSGDDELSPVTLDLRDAGLVQLMGPSTQAEGLVAAMVVQLMAIPADERPEVVLAMPSLEWLATLVDQPMTPPDMVWAQLGERLRGGHHDEDAPLVAFVDAEAGLPDVVDPASGVTVVYAGQGASRPDAGPVVELADNDQACLWPQQRVFRPQLVLPAARRALEELVTALTSTDYIPAPWWSTTPKPDAGLVAVSTPAPVPLAPPQPVPPWRREGPVLEVLGPVQLSGARGVEPVRAAKQCLEYCGWLLRFPGQPAYAMSRSLLVAEGTRRSNVSRLRLWLGQDDAGELYLPEAYSGRIKLSPAVGSDWQRAEELLADGVDKAPTRVLKEVLGMVRGVPLQDATPGAWGWAEGWRVEMCSVIRDVGVVLGERALAGGDIELARWAVERASKAAPGDERLLGCRVRAEHLAGNRAEVERLVASLTRRARSLGVDLCDDTVALLREVMDGPAAIAA